MTFDWRAIAVVAVGAGIGGVVRLLVTQFFVVRAGAGYGQYATMLINVSGSFLIGMVMEMAQTRAGFDPLLRVFLATGILGGFTTFSTFSYEALTLATEGSPGAAALYAFGSVGLGIGAAVGGIATARALNP